MRIPLFVLALSCAIWTCNIGSILAQSNLNFENWTGNECDGWGSINNFMFLGAPQTTWKDTVAPGEGMASVKLESVYWWLMGLGSFPDTVGGILSLGGPPTGPLGIAYTNRPISVDFMYKSKPLGGDTGLVLVQLSHRDIILDSTIVDGEGFMIFPDSVSVWTTSTISIDYFTSNTPDTLKIIASSSGGTLSGSGLGIDIGSKWIGSELYLDAFAINLPVDIKQESLNAQFEIYPNPTTGRTTVTNLLQEATKITIYNVLGKLVQGQELYSSNDYVIDLTEFPAGLYYLQVMGETINHKRRIIKLN